MKTKRRMPIYKRFCQIVLSSLSGQGSVLATVTFYAVVAALLLAYVSAQILTGALTQEITELRTSRSALSEDLNRLTGEYVSLTSRARVSDYCREKLGMVEASQGILERVVLRLDDDMFLEPSTLTRNQSAVPDAYRFTLNRLSEAMR